MEILDLYNDLGEAVGETIVRGEKTDKGHDPSAGAGNIIGDNSYIL